MLLLATTATITADTRFIIMFPFIIAGIWISVISTIQLLFAFYPVLLLLLLSQSRLLFLVLVLVPLLPLFIKLTIITLSPKP